VSIKSKLFGKAIETIKYMRGMEDGQVDIARNIDGKWEVEKRHASWCADFIEETEKKYQYMTRPVDVESIDILKNFASYDWAYEEKGEWFILAAMNYAIFLGVATKETLPDYEELVDVAAARHGAPIHLDKTLEACGVKEFKTEDTIDVLRRRQHGIVCLDRQPCLFIRIGDNMARLVNFEEDGEDESYPISELLPRVGLWNHQRENDAFYTE